MYDAVSGKISADTTHLSHFAVLGEKIYPLVPETHLEVIENEQLDNGWYQEFPTVELLVEDYNGIGIENTFYSLDGGLNWSVYITPLKMEINGITTVLFKSIDAVGNLEETKSHVLKIDTLGRWKNQLSVVNSGFATNYVSR